MKKLDIKCPTCGQETVYLALEFQAAKIGEFSLAGEQVKFSMNKVPVLVCYGEKPGSSQFDYDECPFRLVGTVEGDQAVFVRPHNIP